jgi:hypothetical protein
MAQEKRIPRATRKAGGFWADVAAAQTKLYARPLTQAQWLLQLSRIEAPTLTEEEAHGLRVELLVFAKGTPMPARKEAVTIAEADVPSTEVLGKAAFHVRYLLGCLTRDKRANVEAHRWGATLQLKNGRITGSAMLDDLSLLDAFTVRVYETLADLPSKRAWLFPCSICRKFFIAKRRDSRLCSSSCRTLEWRRAHPEEFRTKRAEAYQRMLQRKTGQKRVRVQPRRKPAPAS